MIIYFDVSCLNRPFDDQRQLRIRLETEAVAEIIGKIEAGHWTDVSSEMALREIAAIRNTDRRERIMALLPDDRDIIELTEAMLRRAKRLQVLGFRPADAVHVAAAEATPADVMLSCDDQLCRVASRRMQQLQIEIANPVDWLERHQ